MNAQMLSLLAAATTNDSITVSPAWPLLVYTAYALFMAAAAVVVALKGRWIWLLVGMFTLGLAILAAAFLPAEPDSTWARRARRRQSRRTASA
jgi:hypothetical protein